MAQIIVKEGNSSRSMELSKDITSIGRSGKNEVVLRHSSISRIHAQIRRIPGGGYLIADFDSRNGIIFNGNRIKERKLEPGDEIEIGEALIIFAPTGMPATPSGTGEKEKSQPKEKSIAVGGNLAADEFIGAPVLTIHTIVLRILITLAIVFIVGGFGYIKIKERAEQTINLAGAGASFEQYNPMDMSPSGWQMPADNATKISVTDREAREGKYSLLVEKDPNRSFFDIEVTLSPIIKIPFRMKTNPALVYNFGGWVKISTLKKSLAGFRINWFDSKNQLVRSDYTNYVLGSPEWRHLYDETRPPADAEYGRFYCAVLGANAETYFDEVSVYITKSENPALAGKNDNFNLKNQSFRLTVMPSGAWTLEDTSDICRFSSELLFKPSSIASLQNYYSLGKTTDANENQNISLISQVVNPSTLETINIPLTASISPVMAVSYQVPTALSNAIGSDQLSLITSLSMESLRYLKIVNPSGVQDKKFYNTFSEKMVSEVNLGLSDKTVIFKYARPVSLTVTRDGDMLSLTQTFQGNESMPANATDFRVEFELKSNIQNRQKWETMLNRAGELEKSGDFGEAMLILRSVTLEADAKSDIFVLAGDRLKTLEKGAQETFQNANDILAAARILKDYSLYDKAAKTFQEIAKLYVKIDSGTRANDIVKQIKSEVQQMKISDNAKNADKILAVANGLFNEKQLNQASALYEQIVEKYSDTPAAQTAKDNLEKIRASGK